MYIVDLECSAGHSFEGWYDSAHEYEALAADDDITCPLCEQRARRVPSASRISTSTTRGEKSSATPRAEVSEVPSDAASGMPLEVQQQLAKLVQHVRRTHEDVGDNFAKRATAMHRGDEQTVPIRGTSTPDEEDELRAEGIPYAKLPIPDIEQN